MPETPLRNLAAEAAPNNAKCPLPPAICAGCNIFDCLISAPLLLTFCLLSWTHGAGMLGRYAFFRGGTISPFMLSLLTLIACAAILFGIFLLIMRIRHKLYCNKHFPKPKKAKGPNVFADMRDALDQLLGIKPYEGIDKEEQLRPGKERKLGDWLRHEKTRLGLSAFMLAVLMYLTPGFIIHLMGTHVLMYFLLEFSAVMTAITMWLIAWVELAE